MKRKKRSDANHCIYIIINKITGEKYVGITIAINRAFQYSVKQRFAKHVSRAKCESHDWALYKNMREYGVQSFDCKLIEVIRGKSEAHKKESEMIHSGEFILNTHGMK